MDAALDDLLSVIGGGQDETGQLVLDVLTRNGGQAVLRVTDQAARELLYCIPLAVLGQRVKGTA